MDRRRLDKNGSAAAAKSAIVGFAIIRKKYDFVKKNYLPLVKIYNSL